MPNNESLTQKAEFSALRQHYSAIAPLPMRDMFAADPGRFEKLHIKTDGLLFDYSKHRITTETLPLLVALAKSCGVEDWRDKMFSGGAVNTSENRPALHTALRGSGDDKLSVDGENVAGFVKAALAQIKTFSDKIRSEKKITDIVNIGVGGSDLGARTVCEALAPYADGPRTHFVPNIDGAALGTLLKSLKPESTVFIVASKSFTTFETLMNAQAALKWSGGAQGKAEALVRFAAVTENAAEARKFGIAEENIFPMRKWIGGRMSVWGAAGLSIALSAGFENFQNFLAGAKAMDAHFREAPLDKNIPVIMALLGVWYRNFFGFPAQAVIPYSQGLRTFPSYLQQLDMESNGKCVDRAGKALDYASGPVIFGEPGINAQHAFFQVLHQGTDIVPCDFIIAAASDHDLPGHNMHLCANALAQAKGLMEGHENEAEPHRHYPGNRPSSLLIFDRFDAFHLGMLLALYEHKIFTQGLIWNINSFDQWGVERGKTLYRDIAQAFENKTETSKIDPATAKLMAYIQGRR